MPAGGLCAERARTGAAFPGAAALRGARPRVRPPTESKPGSNNWAVAGVHTRSGVALVANDMHLGLGVPAVWYPARLR